MTDVSGTDSSATDSSASAWPAATRARLAAHIAARAGAAATHIEAIERLVGGAIQENWGLAVAVEGGPHASRHAWVLRTTAPAPVAASRPQAQEFALLCAAHGAGVLVPEPLWHCGDVAVIGRPFTVMRRLAGTAVAPRVVKAVAAAGAGAALARQLGAELAKIHAIVPPRPDLAFLEPPQGSAATAAIADYRAYLDGCRAPHPALEWGLRWLERQAPPPGETVLVHRDYRTGNYIVGDDGALAGILDWEFAGWGAPLEDIGWFCAKCWRFGATDLAAGGIAARAPFYAGYEDASGRRIERDGVHYWEVMAHVRWAVIALQQGERHVSGAQRDLELALIGRRPAELEYEILAMTSA